MESKDYSEIRDSSIRLSQLNPSLSQKLSKFDTTNDGSLSNQELISAVVTLQKQSNVYKKMVWFMIPILLSLILSIFGMTYLAIQLTKELYVSHSSAILTNSNGEVVKTADAFNVPIRFNSFVSNSSTLSNKIKPEKATIKTLSYGSCYLSNNDLKYYLQLDDKRYTSINNINSLDVLYMVQNTPYKSFDYNIISRSMDSNWKLTLQSYNPQCQYNFIYDCLTEEFTCVYTYCMDPNIIYQCQLFSTTENYGGPEGGGNDGGSDGGDGGGSEGKYVSSKLTAITKIVSVKTSSYSSYMW